IFHGPPGLGKTTLAKIVAQELGAPFYQTSGPSIDKPGDLAGILAGLEPSGVLFIDEIHRLPITVEEILYSAMEDFCVDILVGQGPTARTVRMPINPFTLIGATTRMASLSAPLLSRFGIQEHLEFYTPEALSQILLRSARLWQVELAEDGAMELARRSRGTPRIANRLLRRVRDFADFHGVSCLHRDIVDLTLTRLHIDAAGLDKMDRRILRILRDRYNGGPVGIEALSATIGDERTTIEDVYEPYLMHQGFIRRGPRGRELTALALQHLDLVTDIV
ncbi:MAG: Holliday junction branch migration DNA helicase RuvB, partial [Oligoflexus sp.]